MAKDYAAMVLDERKEIGKDYSKLVMGEGETKQEAFQPEEPPALARIGRGMMDFAQGGKQVGLKLGNLVGLVDDKTVNDYDKQVSDELNIYKRGAGDDFDWWRMGGNFAATAPAMGLKLPATLLGKMVQGGLLGGTMGGLTATGEGDSRLLNTGVGMTGGAIAPALIQGGANAAGFAFDKTKNMVARNFANRINVNKHIDTQYANYPDAVRANLKSLADKQLLQSGQIDDAAIERVAQAESLGFTGNRSLTASQANRDPLSWTRERNLQKVQDVGTDITARYKSQNERFGEIMRDLKAATGGTADDVIDAGKSIIEAVNKRYKDTQKAVSGLYKEVRSKYGDIDGILPDKLNSKLTGWKDDATADEITNSITRRLNRFGLYKDGEPTGKTLTVSQAEEFRKFIGGLGDGGKPNLKRIKREAIELLDNDVFDGIGDDVFSTARSEASKRFTEFEKSIAGKIVNDKVGDNLFKTIMSGDIADIAYLKQTLSQADGGDAAWNNFKSQVVEYLNNKATQDMGTDGVFNGTQFKKELNRIGAKKLNEIFGEDQTKFLYSVADTAVNITREPAFSSVNHSNSAPALLNYMMSGTKDIPFLGGAISGRNNAIQVQRMLNNEFDPIKQAALRRAAVNKAITKAGSLNTAIPILTSAGLLNATN